MTEHNLVDSAKDKIHQALWIMLLAIVPISASQNTTGISIQKEKYPDVDDMKLKFSDARQILSTIYETGKMKEDAVNYISWLIDLLKNGRRVFKWRDTEISIAGQSARALVKIGRAAAGQLILALNAEQWRARYHAAWALGEIKDTCAVIPLMNLLNDKEMFVRMEAIEALQNIHDDRAVNSIISMMSDKDYGVRMAAAKALSDFSDPVIVGVLVSALYDSEYNVAHQAAQSLIKIASHEVADFLIPKLSESNFEVRYYAFEILGERGDTAAVIPFISMLNSDDADEQGDVINILGQIGDKRAAKPLIKMLEEHKHISRIISALGKIKDISAIKPLHAIFRDTLLDSQHDAAVALYKIIGQAFVDTLINDLDSFSKKIKKNAIEALGSIKEIMGVEPIVKVLADSAVYRTGIIALGKIGDTTAIPSLCEALGNSDEQIQNAAWEGLFKTPDKLAVLRSLVPLLSGDNATARREAISLIYGFENPDTSMLYPIAGVLNDSNDEVNHMAILALGKTKDLRAIQYLKPLLNSRNPETRKCVVEALGNIDDSLSLELLTRALNDKIGTVRQKALSALLRSGNEKAFDAFIRALKDKERDIRRIAVMGLLELQDDRTVAPLIHILQQDKDSLVRAEAAIGLLTYRDPRSIEPLIIALGDESWEVRYNAHTALINMTGAEMDADPQKWRLWWKENKQEYLKTEMFDDP